MEVIVTEKDIIGTYSTRQQKLAYKYLNAISLLNESPNLWKLSKGLSIPYNTLKHWVSKESVPLPIKTIDYLKSRSLLPLTLDSSSNVFRTFIHCFAFVFGDGHIGQRFEAAQSAGNYDDLVKLRHEVERDLKIKTNDRIYKSSENSHRFNISNTAFARLLYAAGAPRGDKTTQKVLLPDWLTDSDKNVKLEFLSVLFGNELETPRSQSLYTYTINSIVFTVHKNINLEENVIRYLSQITNILKEFGIETGEPIKTNYFIVRKDGSKNYKFVFRIQGNMANVLRFYAKFSLAYASQKQKEFDRLIKGLQKHIADELGKCQFYYKTFELRNRLKWGSYKIAKYLNFSGTTIGHWIYDNKKPRLLGKEETTIRLLESLKYEKAKLIVQK